MLYLLRLLILVLLTIAITPFLALVALTLVFFNLVHLATRFTRPAAPAAEPPLSGLASIIILNWNGKELLAEGLPSVLEAVRADGKSHEILVVDNGSTDGSVEYVRSNFPEIRILALPENLGFGEGNNAGVRAATHDIVVLLNNDMVVDRGFLRPLLDGFGPNTFAVSSQIFMQDSGTRREETGKTTAVFRRGMIDFAHRPVVAGESGRRYYPAFWAGGGSSAFHRHRFLALGGFREIYSPAYVEDTDLSYQAWKTGWDVLFAPASVVHHKHRASSRRRFPPLQIQVLVQKNQFLFLWLNIRSWPLVLSHCAFLPWTCLRLARDHGIGIWLSLIEAAARISLVEVTRLGAAFRGSRSDMEIFELFRTPGAWFSTRQSRIVSCRGSSGRDPRPRVLWLTAYLPHLGRHAGAGRMYQLLARISRKYRITLLTFLEYDHEREFLSDLASLCEEVVAIRRYPPPRWHLFPYEPFDEFRTPEMAAAMRDCLEERDFDLIQLEYSQMGCYAELAAGIPVLLTKHEVDFAACARRARVEQSAWRKLRWFYNYLQVLDREIRLLRGIDGVICMTDPDARELRKFCSSVAVHVVNTGVDLDYFRPPLRPAGKPRLVFVGAFQHQPNVDAMIYFCRSILPPIRSAIPQVELAVVGSNPPPEIAALAELPGVEVTGSVPDVRPYMAESAVYVVPLRLGVGIRGKILEAWSMRMAVVATPVASAGLRCEHDRNILIAGDDATFAASIVSLLNDPVRRERLGTAGRRVAEEYYGWDASARQLEMLYERYGAATLPTASGAAVSPPESHACNPVP